MTLLERVAGEAPPRIVVFENSSDSTLSADEREFRVWCMEIFDHEPWSLVPDAFYEDGRLLLEFPPSEYYGMPLFLGLEKHSRYRLGHSVRMFREDGSVLATFQVREQREVPEATMQQRELDLAAPTRWEWPEEWPDET